MLIGFAGLGRMGLPMVRNLAAAGNPVLALTAADLVLGGPAAAPPDHLHVVMGTVGPGLIGEVAGPVAFPIVDAPVSGSTAMAETATL